MQDTLISVYHTIFDYLVLTRKVNASTYLSYLKLQNLAYNARSLHIPSVSIRVIQYNFLLITCDSRLKLIQRLEFESPPSQNVSVDPVR